MVAGCRTSGGVVFLVSVIGDPPSLMLGPVEVCRPPGPFLLHHQPRWVKGWIIGIYSHLFGQCLSE
jgi:hypothetical protein